MLATMACIGGCVDLDEALVSELGSSYLATPQGLNEAVNAVYASLQGFYGRGETDYGFTQYGTDTWTATDGVTISQSLLHLDT